MKPWHWLLIIGIPGVGFAVWFFVLRPRGVPSAQTATQPGPVYNAPPVQAAPPTPSPSPAPSSALDKFLNFAGKLVDAVPEKAVTALIDKFTT